MIELRGKEVVIHEESLRRRERKNKEYLMSLKNEHLLLNYKMEAGLFSGRGHDSSILGGWEDPTCQLRGHFLGHWISAAAFQYEETKDMELKAKADAIVAELAICQEENGGEWVGPIPEKYMDRIAKGKWIWAPQYNLHKLFMGLIDAYRFMGNEQALTIADRFADWFYNWSNKFTRDEFDNILDVETGGMLEAWADLLIITKKNKYQELLKKYYRGRLFNPLLAGNDVLTNMHANTTIPEVLGCARAFEATGDANWMEIVKAYWKCAVTDRGELVTGGQTQGEIWMPLQKIKARLGDKNQEHCTVYNMMRLAEFLFRYTKDPSYLQYMEYNLYNGVMAQTYRTGRGPEQGSGNSIVTYFLPMKAASRKDWAGERDAFFCCHGTTVQANAAFNRNIYYQEKNCLYVAQYFDSTVTFQMDAKRVKIEQKQDYMNGSLQTSSENNARQTINGVTNTFINKPDFKKIVFTIHCEEKTEFTLSLRIPEWITKEASIYVNNELIESIKDSSQFYSISRKWEDGNIVTILLPLGIQFITLPDAKDMGAFRYGPEVLAGLCKQERVLKITQEDITEELSADTEREWGNFRTFYRTENQDPGINFMKLNEIGYEDYQVYFKKIKMGE
ncbi:MAG TPA: beta-L-arabinofuranosidase domain-containing protein [Lachnospiraceae bacterium]|nr:beta-L-arabinofuranosidase domain-containing protein [Lachnospiraceae bacterium]